MGELYGTSTFKEMAPNAGVKEVLIKTPATADAGDTIVVSLGSMGMKSLLGITEYIHTTDGSVIEVPGTTASGGAASSAFDNSTTSVSSGVLTITLGTGTNLKHVFRVVGE